MANIKDYGLEGVANTVQLGKGGGTLSYDTGLGRYAFKQSNTVIYAATDVGSLTAQSGGVTIVDPTQKFEIDDASISRIAPDVLSFDGNAAVRIPVGNDSERPAGETGMIRVNQGANTFVEFYDGTQWTPIGTGGGGGGTPGGLNTEIQFNDNGAFGGTSNLTFDKTTNTLTTVNIGSPADTDLTLVPGANGLVVLTAENGGGMGLEMGLPTLGNLVSNAVALTTDSKIPDAIAQLNTILGKLVPPSPPNFPAGQTLTITGTSTYRMCNYVQTDNTPAGNKNVAGGTTVTSVLRTSSYGTNTISNGGPGDTGTVSAVVNETVQGSRTLTSALNGAGTYGNLVITNNADYNTIVPSVTAGFWSIVSARASGTVTQGWNEVRIAHSAAANTNTPSWFFDSASPGDPQVTNTTMTAPVSPTLEYSSTVPHYNSTNSFTLTFNTNRLSGNTYPTSDTFVTGTAGGSFNAPASVTYAGASITTPLLPNLFVASGNTAVSTTAGIITGFGSSSSGPSVTVQNSYSPGTGSFSPGSIVLYKTGTTSSLTRIEETNIFIGSTIGVGGNSAFRIINPGSTNTPVFTANAPQFNSQTSTLETYDATVVANVLRHDVTNYSTGYLPAGPNLSVGRSGTQYFTFKFVRASVSKFDIRFTGTVAGMWVALPGSLLDSTSGLNGWLNMAVAYGGAGAPGSNIAAGGNGSDGCALGGPVTLNSAQNRAFTCTFGTVSSSSTATNEIYVRIALTSGQSVTALSLQTASN